MGFKGPAERYTETIKARVRERGRNDPEFADEMYHQITVKENFDYLWDALMADEIAIDSIKKGTSKEAIEWLGKDSSLVYGSDGLTAETKSTEVYVKQIYQTGAVDVLAINIKSCKAVKVADGIYDEEDYEYKWIVEESNGSEEFKTISGEKTGELAVKLPKNRTARKRVFSWANVYWNKTGHFPSSDCGQDYLILFLE